MGLVFRVRERSGGRDLALKVILPGVADELNRSRFAREAHLMADLSHPRIVRYAGADLDGPVPFLAMELLDPAAGRAHSSGAASRSATTAGRRRADRRSSARR